MGGAATSLPSSFRVIEQRAVKATRAKLFLQQWTACIYLHVTHDVLARCDYNRTLRSRNSACARCERRCLRALLRSSTARARARARWRRHKRVAPLSRSTCNWPRVRSAASLAQRKRRVIARAHLARACSCVCRSSGCRRTRRDGHTAARARARVCRFVCNLPRACAWHAYSVVLALYACRAWLPLPPRDAATLRRFACCQPSTRA